MNSMYISVCRLLSLSLLLVVSIDFYIDFRWREIALLAAALDPLAYLAAALCPLACLAAALCPLALLT